jgi:hypothetical protein
MMPRPSASDWCGLPTPRDYWRIEPNCPIAFLADSLMGVTLALKAAFVEEFFDGLVRDWQLIRVRDYEHQQHCAVVV